MMSERNEHIDREELKQNLLSLATWLRFLTMLVLLICVWAASMVAGVVVFLQFVFVLVTTRPNEGLQQLGAQLGQYLHWIVDFLVFSTDAKPFPFASWGELEEPEGPDSHEPDDTDEAGA
jgi:cytochrome b561